MQLRQEVTGGVAVLSVTGPVTGRHAAPIIDAVDRAMDLGPRAVLVDLTDVQDLPRSVEGSLAARVPCQPTWPRPALLLVGHLPGGYPDRDAALAHVDDRSEAPRSRLTVPEGELGPASARSAVRDWAGATGHRDLADDLALVVSELVTNAVRYGSPPVVVELEDGEQTVTVAVADSGGGRPRARQADSDDEGGRGLLLVELLAAETGVRADPPGKTVWAALSGPPPAPPTLIGL